MKVINHISISNPIVGRYHSFIYCIYILYQGEGIVYVGETNAKNGALGRLSGHMQQDGTFYMRCLQKKGLDIDKIDSEIHMLAISLDPFPEFCGDVNKSNRMALEYFVHVNMEEYSVSDKGKIPFDVVSNVTIANRNADNTYWQNIGQEIAMGFFFEMPFSVN